MANAPPGRSLLVCVYYRIAAGDTAAAIRAVREFQRTLPSGMVADDAQVLLRCELPPVVPDSPDGPADAAAAEHTLMETYRLTLPAPAGSAAANAAVRTLLAALDAAAGPLLALRLGARHVELFAPCAS
ncbi:MAG: DUF4936 family protein [Burkholderiaceae bacterium]